jgi:hypothetical protein
MAKRTTHPMDSEACRQLQRIGDRLMDLAIEANTLPWSRGGRPAGQGRKGEGMTRIWGIRHLRWWLWRRRMRRDVGWALLKIASELPHKDDICRESFGIAACDHVARYESALDAIWRGEA